MRIGRQNTDPSNGSTVNNPLASHGIGRFEGQRRFAAENLKRCPLCGAVNARQNKECFLCSWSGKFEYELEAVEEGLEELLERCPELADLLLEPPTFLTRVRESLAGFWRRITGRRRVDIWV